MLSIQDGLWKSACKDKGGPDATVTVIAFLEVSAYRVKCCAACDSHPADHRHVCMAHLPPDNEHKRVVMGKWMSSLPEVTTSIVPSSLAHEWIVGLPWRRWRRAR